jgi:uncharacterized damage-inducible protein DinB
MKHFHVKKTFLSFFSLILLFVVSAHSQSLSGDSIKAQFIRDWERAKDYTLEYLNTVPADKYSFKPMDSVRTFAQQMIHLAQGIPFLITPATGQKPILIDRQLENAPSAQSKDSVIYFVTTSYDFAIQGLRNLDVSKLGEEVSGGRRKTTRYAWLLKAFEHQTHHRGQTTIYIRMMGLRPPGERLF